MSLNFSNKIVICIHFTFFFEYAIIYMLVQYSSYIVYYEGGAKNPLKSLHRSFLKLRGMPSLRGSASKKIGASIVAYMKFPVFEDVI